MSPNITRRRAVQGIGGLALTGIVGSALVSADETREVQEDQAALRVAHASPDAPRIAVRLGGADDGDAGGTATTAGGDGPLIEDLNFGQVSEYQEVDPGSYRLRIVATESTGFLEGIFGDAEKRVVYDEEIELDGGTTFTAVAYGLLSQSDLGNGTPGGETETPADDAVGEETPTETESESGVGAATETETPTDGALGAETETDSGGQSDGRVLVEGLGYGEYEWVELDAGDYTFQFSEAAASGTETDDVVDEETPTETEAVGEAETETESEGVLETESEMDEGGSAGGAGETPFTVELLEDQLSVSGGDGEGTVGAEMPADETPADETPADETPTEGDVGGETETTAGGGTARIRIFHAVPDVDAIRVVASEGGGGGIFGGGDDETQTSPPTETATDGGAAGAQETETPAGTPGGQSVREASVSLDDGTVYSGFAMGYFDVSNADTTATPGGAETPTDGGVGSETPTDGGVGAETPTDGGVGAETATPGGETGTGTTEAVAEDRPKEFQFVTVADASDGERSDGGSGGGGILSGRSEPSEPSGRAD